MDGNRRWAKKGNLLPYAGHNIGGETLERILEICPIYGIKIVTIYALSSENFLNRSKPELKALMELLRFMAINKKSKLQQAGIKVKIAGNIKPFPQKTRQALMELEDATRECKNSELQICLNYGGKQEILAAARKVFQSGETLSETTLNKHLEAIGSPDLIIRTGGRQRLSNFLLWQAAYTELYFSEKLWPEFDESELKKALKFYHNQVRNFGK